MRPEHFLYSTRSKLIIGILGVCLLVGAVSMLVGGQLLYPTAETVAVGVRMGAAQFIPKSFTPDKLLRSVR